jgi:hypothetical protein
VKWYWETREVGHSRYRSFLTGEILATKQAKKIRGIFERSTGSGIWWIRYADEFGQMHCEKVGMRM